MFSRCMYFMYTVCPEMILIKIYLWDSVIYSWNYKYKAELMLTENFFFFFYILKHNFLWPGPKLDIGNNGLWILMNCLKMQINVFLKWQILWINKFYLFHSKFQSSYFCGRRCNNSTYTILVDIVCLKTFLENVFSKKSWRYIFQLRGRHINMSRS